jgi:cell wall-associated NlpC family hydrolase
MSKAQEVVKAARKYIDEGYKEGPNNNTIFGKRYGMNHQPWCAMYVSCCFADAGVVNLVAASTKKGFASCDAGMKWFAKNGQLIPVGKAQPGDIVFFQFDDDAQPDHVGIVVKNNTKFKQLVCAEGNTSGDAKGSQSNGDGAFLKKRSYSLVMAVARPKW